MDAFFLFFLLSLLFLYLIRLILKNPYHYPYFTVNIDISKRRNVHMQDEIEQYIINHGISAFQNHCNYVEQWKTKTFQKASASLLKPLRIKQYNEIIDDDRLFIFNLCRNQTRYKQQNYVKSSYIVKNISQSLACSYSYLESRYKALEEIGFETTTLKYHAKNQRKLMNESLREKIKKRDNYTCQICGKYMPDEIGLHIDHIIPVSKGGKTVESNLQVLCSKCNGRKRDKI